MTTKEMIAVMQAYEDGKKIQGKTRALSKLNQWTDIDEPNWNWKDLDYRIKPEEKPVRMTNRQLAEWLAKGFGEHTYEGGSSYSDICWDYLLMVENNSVSDDVLIRSWDSDEWIEPTVDIYERDCKGN